MPRIMITVPPRQQPASIRSPGTRSAITRSTSSRTFRVRLRPIIVCAYRGQSRPSLRRCMSLRPPRSVIPAFSNSCSNDSLTFSGSLRMSGG